MRDDSGIYEGSEISVFYDPMISKLITWGATRAEAIERMERALMEYRVGGIKTNLAFHRRVLREPDFRARQVLDGVHRGAQGAARQADRARRATTRRSTRRWRRRRCTRSRAAPQPTAGNGAAATAPTTERSAWQRSSRF